MRDWLVIKRSELGLTQEKVANKAGIARTTYAMIEQNNRTPSVNVAKRIAKVLGVNWTLFFDDECHESCKISVSKPA
ncbi:XRE family transcriptional regulator [Brevibacillus borstelensis AK1]|uniref:XRE family transcriptional regulator n=1 Tax=Brevibacillus borstelensis AK1 TaxID=1300222 RepID=M8EFM0_9BACL|nr:helix-turn-helix transcriptional regulator [Brevibacillus borstelensis]EMT54275.1 XRE family transcriptional regulator [Brevibacillus borstelensis AK1]MED2010911.1 helix-turn-helix transcriptional regulator [Brevibacillus borstelensis]